MLQYTSEPLAEASTVAGPIGVTLFATSTRPESMGGRPRRRRPRGSGPAAHPGSAAGLVPVPRPRSHVDGPRREADPSVSPLDPGGGDAGRARRDDPLRHRGLPDRCHPARRAPSPLSRRPPPLPLAPAGAPGTAPAGCCPGRRPRPSGGRPLPRLEAMDLRRLRPSRRRRLRRGGHGRRHHRPREGRGALLRRAGRDPLRPLRDVVDDPETYRASSVVRDGVSYCIPKSVLLCAAARAVGLAARLGFADVRNHLNSPKLRERLGGTDLFVWHGYTEFLLDGHWVKVTSAFNIELCERFGVLPAGVRRRARRAAAPLHGRRP